MAATTTEWQKYTNNILGVSLDFPSDWGFEESPSVGIVVFADQETLKSQNLGPMSPVINLITQKIPGISLNEFADQQLSRMKEMTGGEIAVDKKAKLGDIPAHKAVSSIPMPGGGIKFFSLWAYANGVGYSFFFHCSLNDFASYGPVLTHMLKSFSAIRTVPQSYILESFSANGVLFRYPASWKITSKSDGSDKSPLVTLSHDDTYKGETTSTTLRLLTTAKKGPLSTHMDLLKTQLEKMHVEKVDIVNTKVGTKDARVAKWSSDVSGSPMRYMHLITTENEEETTPVFSLTLMSNAKENEYDQLEQFFRQIRSSFVFLSESETVRNLASFNGYHHVKFGFGFLYDGKHYMHRTEGIPLTEASFSRVGDDPVNPLVNFSVIVRDLTPGETPDLAAMGDELEENLKGVCGNTLERVENSPVTLTGLPARVLIFHGSAQSPMNPQDVEEMYFVYKYVINIEFNTALLFAFASTPKYWQAEWKIVESYLDTLYWSPA